MIKTKNRKRQPDYLCSEIIRKFNELPPISDIDYLSYPNEFEIIKVPSAYVLVFDERYNCKQKAMHN